MEPFRDTVTALLPGVRLAAPRGVSADGALALARAAVAGSVRPRPPYVYVFSGAG
ncbi:hypothetical protein [Nonomuraea sp. NPDC050691]|uniref:hypothetical protein n=1 Tax=Nonomuraea sp. NPDC050691 TaxID=3155661 RepID=UPI0033C3CF94